MILLEYAKPQSFLQLKKRAVKKVFNFWLASFCSIFHEIDISYVSKKIAQTIGDREAIIFEMAIGIGIGISIFD